MITRTWLTLLAATTIAGAAETARAAAAGTAPNIVLIISDDHGWTDYSFMGHPQVRTPNIDKLAAAGLTFRRGYVPSSLCSPSLASILTGLYPHQHKVTSNDPPLPSGKSATASTKEPTVVAQRKEMIRYFEKVPTLPRMLAGQGYLSFESGKWWGGHFRTGGFTEGMTHGDPERGGRHGDVGLTIGRQTMRPVFDFIDSATRDKKPFFLWYAPMMPHSPHNPPDRFLDQYRGKAPSLEIAKYWAMIAWFDETCGQLLDFLDAKGIANDTIVVYLADNGWIQDPGADRYAPKSKQSQYEGGLHTPIIVRWPGKVSPKMSDRVVTSLDLAPTILAAAGMEPTPQMQGVNLLDETAVARRAVVFGEIFTPSAVDIHRPASSLRYRWAMEGDWKLILPAPQNTPHGQVELYDLAADVLETRNLADQNPQKVAHLKGLIDAWWNGED